MTETTEAAPVPTADIPEYPLPRACPYHPPTGYDRYTASGEINSTVADAPARVEQIRAWAAADGAAVDELDGLTVTRSDGDWFNVRSSNTEPLLRLNVEAATPERMAALRDELLALIRG